MASAHFDNNSIERAARCMKALAHPLRLKVIAALNTQELSVQELVEAVGTTQSNVSQHLTVMRDKQILSSRRVANQVFYRLGDCKVLDLVSLTKSIFCTATNEAANEDHAVEEEATAPDGSDDDTPSPPPVEASS